MTVLTDGVADLQRSNFDEEAQTRQYSPFLRGVNNHFRPLSGVSLVQQWQYQTLSGEESRGRSIRLGKYIQVKQMFCHSQSHEKLSGAVEGLRFLHSNEVVHGALQPVRGTSRR